MKWQILQIGPLLTFLIQVQYFTSSYYSLLNKLIFKQNQHRQQNYQINQDIIIIFVAINKTKIRLIRFKQLLLNIFQFIIPFIDVQELNIFVNTTLKNYFYVCYKMFSLKRTIFKVRTSQTNQLFVLFVRFIIDNYLTFKTSHLPKHIHIKILNTKMLSSTKRNKIQKFRIDKNIILRLHLIEKRSKIIFDATILYSNGLEITLSTNYWKIISNYHQLQTSSIIYTYNFHSNTVNVRSSFNFVPESQPQNSDIQIIITLIKKDVTCFVDKLYRYGMINLKKQFFFKQILQENHFHRKIIDNLKFSQANKKIPFSNKASPQSCMVDENQLQHTSPNIFIYPIQPVKSQVRTCDLPIDLQYGSKNIKYHFGNGTEINQAKGGFFTLQKIFCSINKKKLQKKNQNLQSIQQNLTQQLSQNQILDQKTYVQRDILVRKSLKFEQQQSKTNRLKILKELVIIQQNRNPKHLIKYYLNKHVKNVSHIFNTKDKKESRPEMTSFSSEFSTLNVNERKNVEQNLESIQLTDVYMDFHPHTLNDFIKLDHNSVDSKIKMCLQMIESIIEIHKSKVIHRDLKPENALIDFTTDRFNPILKLIDFSQSAIHISQAERFQNPNIPKYIIREIFDKHTSRFYAATFPYSPPQCQLNRQNRTSKGVNNFQIDYWSLGMILFQIFMGKKLLNYSKNYEEDILNVIKEVGFENTVLKCKKRGFRMIENAVELIALKNIDCDQSKRMNTSTCHDLFNSINKQVNSWTNDFNNQEQQKNVFLIKY